MFCTKVIEPFCCAGAGAPGQPGPAAACSGRLGWAGLGWAGLVAVIRHKTQL